VRVVLLLAVLIGQSALAQTLIPCLGMCPERYYFEAQPCSAGTCSRTAAPVPAEFSKGAGLGLSAYEGVQVTVCAAPGFTLSGAGTLRWWVWEPWMPNDVTSTPAFDLNMADADRGTGCSYSMAADGTITTGGTVRCRCLRFADWKVGGFSSRRLMLQAVGVTASGGSQIEVRMVGLGVVR
jgi:hypothetical protein